MNKTAHSLPGPKGLPLLGNMLQIKKNKLHLQLLEWYELYGPIYKFKPGNQLFVVVADPDVIQTIFRQRPQNFRRISSIEKAFSAMSAHGLFSVEGETWRKHRKLVLPAFQNRNLKEFFTPLIKITERLHKRWQNMARTQKDINMSDDLTRFAVDSITQLAFDYDVNTIEKEGDILQQNPEKFFPAVYRRVIDPLPFLKYFNFPRELAAFRAKIKIRHFLDKIINNYRNELNKNPELGQRPKNLLESFLNAQDLDGSSLTDDEIFGNAMIILMAGEDTTAYSLAWTMHHLIEHPEIQEKMKEEVQRILGGEPMLRNFEDTEKLIYVEAVILESMRLKSVAPFLFLETNVECTLNGMQIPANTPLFTLTSAAALDEANFTNSKKFHPERWISELRPQHWKHNVKAFSPFGGGTRVCPGKSLAMLEMKVVLSMLCTHFSLKKPLNGEVPRDELEFVAMAKNVWARLEC